jgi:hypothetical protein
MVEGRTCSSTDKQLGGDLKKDLPSQTNRKTQLKLLQRESPRLPTGAFAENCTTGRTVGCLPRTHRRRAKAPVPARTRRAFVTCHEICTFLFPTQTFANYGYGCRFDVRRVRISVGFIYTSARIRLRPLKFP